MTTLPHRATLTLILLAALITAGVSALDGYDYYQEIEYSGCDQETYQQDITIHRTAGTAYEETAGGLNIWHIYVGDHCREDYGDVRFVDASGDELAYYLWPDYDEEIARVAVRLDGADRPGSMTIHYGNPSATTTTSTGEDIYVFFDHFDETALNSTKWSKVGSPSVSGSRVTVNAANAEIKSTQTFGVDLILEGSGSLYNANYHIFGWGQHPSYPIAIYQYGHPAGGQYNARHGVSGQDYKVLGAGYTGEHTWAIHRVSSSSTKYYIDGNLVGTLGPSQVPTVDMPVLLQQHVTGVGSSSFDYILVRAYSSTPPALLSASGEQESAAPPRASLTATPTIGARPLTVSFTDTSTSHPTSWLWDFGDGTSSSTAQHPQHTYTAVGTYTITLTATNEYGDNTTTRTDYIDVGDPPAASFTATPPWGYAPLTVSFTDTSTNSPTSWLWDFGDGTSPSTAQHPQHTYTAVGTYTITLTATNKYGSTIATRTVSARTILPFPGIPALPRDLDGDGLYEDINGNGRLDYNDLTTLFLNFAWARQNQPIDAFDYNQNGRLDYADIITLFQVIIHA